MPREQRALFERSEQRLQGIETKGTGLATVATNDQATLRLANLQAASRNDLAIATIIFATWAGLAVAGVG